MPIISIICPVYRAEKFLHRCVDSILMQTFTDFELLLIDDGSPDNSGKICDEYAVKDSRIRVFHKENGGVSSARNLGLKHAIGAWVGFVDADDWLGRDYLQPLTSVGNEAEVIHFGFKQVDRYGRIKYRQLFSTRIIPSSQCFTKEFFSSFSFTYFFKRSLIIKLGLQYNTNVKYSEDREFIIKALLSTNKVLLIRNLEYSYEYNATSAVHTRREYFHIFDDLNVLRNIYSYVDTSIKTSEIKREIKREIEFVNDLLIRSFIQVCVEQNVLQNNFQQIILDAGKCMGSEYLPQLNNITLYNRFKKIHVIYILFWKLRNIVGSIKCKICKK